jgi:hypothetical protein
MNTETKREPKKVLTEVELKAIREARAKAREEDRAAALALEPMLPKMSRRQIQGRLDRIVRKNSTKEGFIPGLDLAFATVLSIVYANTQSKENPFAKLSHYVR